MFDFLGFELGDVELRSLSYRVDEAISHLELEDLAGRYLVGGRFLLLCRMVEGLTSTTPGGSSRLQLK